MGGKGQKRVISEFVAYLAEVKGISLQITKWPDEENRSTKDIDAIAKGDGTRVAIEHTTIDTVPQQREDSARFMEVFGELGTQLHNSVKDRIRLTVDFCAVPNKTNWSKLRQTLKDWLEKTIPNLPYGSNYYEIPGLPFKIHINKQISEKPSFRVGRFDPEDKTLPQRINDAINRKTQKLGPYKKQGYKTLLLIGNDDIALMSLELIVSSIKTIMEGKSEIALEADEIWYADTSIPDDLEFWLIWSKRDLTCISNIKK